MIDLTRISGFDWDDGNARKNEKHGVSQSDAEEVFFHHPLLLLADARHSAHELRFHALGKTRQGRTLHITFTLRHDGTLIRVISARDMHRNERSIHEQAV
ncbi:BrnT family toxin [Accumulibacter sp.]|jgi:uncharacterized DUF497 family protein|uniref:BrnT family toxin n=1 Tax=Accumulibacter sp. TaxID=2053492 RepID=UPI001ACDF6BD|nr:BrnT family toxin [Accumulibacter sp.]MBN8454446.1 BrnT family toxin [Accumulibacter sp.]